MKEHLTPLMSEPQQQAALNLSMKHLRPPSRVPGYESEKLLGRGAYGEVWAAVNRNTGQQVAIKFFSHRGGVDWPLLSREVEKLRFLFTFRHIVQLLEVGWEADPPYYVMEYLSGGSLEDLLRRGTMPVNEAVEMFREILIGITNAHGKGILHCDLKPANILIDNDGKPRLADFGQSRLTHEQEPALGTLFYMAPEQANIHAEPDVRWDVYALGALLYRMVTGAPPYRTDQAVADIQNGDNLEKRLEAYRRLLQTSPKPKAHKEHPEIDRSLAEIIDRCLAVNPKDRFPNAHAIIAALDSRRLRQARRPLILLGVVGPIFGMLIVAIIGWMAFNSVIDDTQRTLIAKTRLSKRSDANFMRKAVEGQIVKRFHALEREAANPALKAALEAATGKPIGSPEQKKLQSWLAQFRQENNLKLDASPEDVWFINDRNGVQLARVPVDLKRETRGKNFSFRSYFHGGAKDAQRHRKMPPAKYVDAYLSPMFQNMARDKWVAPFSVCIWKGAPGESEVLGILTMTVQVGDFTELRSRRDEDGQLEFPILVDLNNGGLVLQHHELQRRRQDDPDARLRIFRLQDEEIDLIKSALGFGGDKPPADADQRKLQWSDKRWMNEIRDPVNLQKPDSYSGPWLAWFEPIVIRGKPSGLVVIAQESGEKLLKPVEELKTKLGWLGLYALGLMVAFITMLWSFVAIVLNDSPRSRLARAFRRRIGLPSSSLALPSGTVSLTGTVGQTNRTDGTADKGI